MHKAFLNYCVNSFLQVAAYALTKSSYLLLAWLATSATALHHIFGVVYTDLLLGLFLERVAHQVCIKECLDCTHQSTSVLKQASYLLHTHVVKEGWPFLGCTDHTLLASVKVELLATLLLTTQPWSTTTYFIPALRFLPSRL